MTEDDNSVYTPEALVEKITIDFETYEAFCNQDSQSSRKAGILSDEIYEAALEDARTVFTEIDGVRIPVLVDIEYGLGLGYDESRARAYAGDERPIAALAVPIGDFDPEMQKTIAASIAESGPRAIFFADNEDRDITALQTGLSTLNFTEQPLLDRRCRPDNRQASLSLYISDETLNDIEVAEAPRVSLETIQKHFDESVLPTIKDPLNASVLKNGANFSPDELDDIWALYLDKFELLGENHPISMEDSREDFLGLITDPSVTVSMRYDEGKPVCFTYFTEEFDQLYWLNADYLKAIADEKPNYTTLFFPGIVSGKAAGGYAHEVIALFAETGAATGLNTRIIFENTNLSEMYVPRIVQDAVSTEPRYDVEKPRKVDQTIYRLATID